MSDSDIPKRFAEAKGLTLPLDLYLLTYINDSLVLKNLFGDPVLGMSDRSGIDSWLLGTMPNTIKLQSDLRR
jgi:hypothetical protein